MSAVQIVSSESHIIHSISTGRDYQIMVGLPLGYHASADEKWPFNNPPKQWPVVYVLDGNWNFAMIASIVHPMSWCGGMSEAIVVGIGYPEDPNEPIEGFRATFSRRSHDLTPVYDEATEKEQSEAQGRPVPNGDGLNFLRFIKEEVVPLIEREYRADPARRILMGHSYGGLLALHAMLREPELFSTLIAASPYMAYGDRGIIALEEEYASTHSDLSARLFLSCTIREMSADDSTLADTLLLAEQLEKRKYPGLQVVTKIFTEFNHCEGAQASFHAGLVYALKR